MKNGFETHGGTATAAEWFLLYHASVPVPAAAAAALDLVQNDFTATTVPQHGQKCAVFWDGPCVLQGPGAWQVICSLCAIH